MQIKIQSIRPEWWFVDQVKAALFFSRRQSGARQRIKKGAAGVTATYFTQSVLRRIQAGGWRNAYIVLITGDPTQPAFKTIAAVEI